MKNHIKHVLMKHERNMNRIRISVILAIVVLFITVTSLILPAVTLTKKDIVLDCPYEVHQHTEDCYEEIYGEHGELRKTLTCGYANYFVHVHDDNCFDNNGSLACNLPENREHIHDKECYEEEKILVCGQEEGTDHRHTDACYSINKVLICGQNELHTHDESCYDGDGKLVCGKLQLEQHQHGEKCLIEEKVEDMEEETFSMEDITADAVTTSSELPKAGEESEEKKGAEPGDETETEGKPETEEAESEDGSQEEEKSSGTDTQWTFEEETAYVTVRASADAAAFPEGTTISVKDVDDQETIDAITDAVENEVKQIHAVDITFQDKNGKEIEPAATVRITMSSAVVARAKQPVVVHVDDSGKAEIVEQLDQTKLSDALAKDEVVFDAEKFSVYAIVGTTIEKNVLASDGMNYKVTVTYGAEAGIPDGAELEVSEILDATDEYSALVTKVQNELDTDETVGYARFFDIKIVANDEVIQPIASVQVSISLDDLLENTVYAAHFSEDAAVQLINTSHDGDMITFDAESFSIYGVVTSALENGQTLLYHNSFDGESSDGVSGNAIYMDGTGTNWINAGNVIGNNSRVTVSYWAMPTRTGTSWAYYASRSNDSSYNTDRYIGTFTNGNDLHVERYNNGRTGNNTTYYSVNPIDYIEEWNYYTIVYDTTTTYIYVNGELIETKYNQPTINNILGNNSYFQIGKANWGGGEYYQGYIDEFSVVSGAMSSSQVAELYNNSKEGVEEYWNNHNKVKVYVYVAAYDLEGNQFKDNPEFLELLGISGDTVDVNGYFPVGEIELDRSFFTGKTNAYTDGSPLITSVNDWSAVLAALGELNTSTLVDQNGVAYSGNRGNNVGDYMSQAVGDINRSWGSKRTALFHWPTSNWSYGFSDQSVTYHLDLRFQTNKVTFITGNNGITSGSSRDGTTVDVRAYILGSEIQQPRNLVIPAGYRLVGYYNDPDFTTPWDKIGTPITQDEVAYIKITPQNNVILHYKPVPAGGGTVSLDAEGLNPETGTPAGSTATANSGYHFVGWYADEECTQLLSTDATYKPTKTSSQRWVDGTTYYAKFEEDTVTLTFVAEEHVHQLEMDDVPEDIVSYTFSEDRKTLTVVVDASSGSPVTVKGVAENGYAIKEWTIDGRTGNLTTADEITTAKTDDPAATDNLWTDRTYHVWAEVLKTITVTKEVNIVGTLKAQDVNGTVYFALKDLSQDPAPWIYNADRSIYTTSIQIVNGVPQGTAQFVDLPAGTYEVWEVADTNAGSFGPGSEFAEGVVVSRIQTWISDTDTGNDVILSDDNPNGSIKVINTLNHAGEAMTFWANKKWFTEKNSYADANAEANVNVPAGAWVDFTLYRVNADGSEVAVQTIRLDGTANAVGEEEAWAAAFRDLPTVDDEGKSISYYVKETAMADLSAFDYYTTFNDTTYTNGGSISNVVAYGNVNVTKEIELPADISEEDKNAFIDALQITVVGPSEVAENRRITRTLDKNSFIVTESIKNVTYGTTTQSVKALTLTAAANDLPAGTYTVEETGYNSSSLLYTWDSAHSWIKADKLPESRSSLVNTEQYGEVSIDVPVGVNVTDNNFTTTVNLFNSYVVQDIKATKVWNDLGMDGADHPSVSITLYRTDSDGNKASVSTQIIGANQTGDNLTLSWSNQPQTYTYSVEEAVVEGYTLEAITGNAEEGFIVTNKRAAVIKIVKTDQSGEPLAGAVFSSDLFKGAVRTEITGEGEKWAAIILDTTNVALGTYTLTETSSPAGYNSLEGSVVITVEEGSAAGDIVVKATINGQTSAFAKAERVNINGSASEWIITIRNDAGIVLPSTGGHGTTLIYLLGIMLTSLAGAGLVMKRRRRRDAVSSV